MGEFERVSLPSPPRGGDAETSGGHDAGDGGSLAGPDGLPGIGGTDGFGGFGRSFLTDAVGRGQTNRPEDVFQASSFLAANSLLPAPTRDADESFLRGIEQGQVRLSGLADGGLFVDGIAKPWGPTEMLSQRAVTSGRMKMPASGPDPTSNPVTAAGTLDRSPAQQAETARTIQATIGSGNRPSEPSIGARIDHSADTSQKMLARGTSQKNKGTLVSDRPLHTNNPASKREATARPIVNMANERIDVIITNKPAIFEVRDNPKADGSDPWYASPSVGKTSVLNYEELLNKEARKQGVDPDLAKAIIFAENARGHYFGLAKTAEGLGAAKTILPMNINPRIWTGLGIDAISTHDPATNIRVGVTLIKRISDRIVDPTPAKIASVWNFAGRENVNDFGAYVGRVYREKPWAK